MAGKASSAMLRLASYETQRADATPAQQAVLGPEAHQAFAQEIGERAPLPAVAATAAAIPAYTAAKAAVQNPEIAMQLPFGGPLAYALGQAFKVGEARSPASFKEMGAAYQGLADGLKERWFGSK